LEREESDHEMGENENTFSDKKFGQDEKTVQNKNEKKIVFCDVTIKNEGFF
jgi:hypothetical protein